jgi:hypothetical protein
MSDFELLYQISILIPFFFELKLALVNQDLEAARGLIEVINPILLNLLNLIEGNPHYSAISFLIRRIMDGMEILNQLLVANPNLSGTVLQGCYYDIVVEILQILGQIAAALINDSGTPIETETLVFNTGAR